MAILVTTDGSPRSLEALPHAAAFARATGNSLHLFRVLDPLMDVEIGTAPAADAIAAVISRWDGEMAGQLASAGADGETSVRVLPAGMKVHEVICRAALELGAPMIALSSHGAGLIRHAVLGSVAMGVVGGSGLPVMVAGPRVEAPVAAGAAYRLAVATDGSDASASIVRSIAEIPGLDRLELALLRIYQPRLGDQGERREIAAARDELKELARALPAGKADVLVEAMREFERVDHALLRVAGEAGASALAMATHGYTRAHHMFAGSVTVGALQHSPLPLVIARSL